MLGKLRIRRRDFLRLAAASPLAGAVSGGVSIDGGRQLFFDDKVIAHSTLEKTWRLPKIHEASPVLKPETPLEMNGGARPVACPFSDGVFYDPKDRLFKMWYHAGWFDGIGYATSEDGIRWMRPNLDIEPGTNRVLAKRDGYWRDGSTTWLDLETQDPSQRYKMFAYFRRRKPLTPVGEVYTSADGIHWDGPHVAGECTDNTNFFYDPFRKQWVWSIRREQHGRMRVRRVASDFLGGASWEKGDIIGPLLTPDEFDKPEPGIGDATQLYHMEAVAYENFMLGIYMIHRGPANKICDAEKRPKITDITMAYSRDGVLWQRPDHRPFIACSREPGSWNRGYAHSTGGVCLMVRDQLYFYFGAWSGISPKLGGDMYAGGSTGLATLRRDGFVSLDAGARGGVMSTPPLQYTGRYLFVNAAANGGEIAVEAIGESEDAHPGFGVKQCVPIRSDGTRQLVRWKGRRDLSSLAGKTVRLRFHLTKAQLYSFWISPDESGASHGYVAAGGPDFTGPRDTVGAGRSLLL